MCLLQNKFTSWKVMPWRSWNQGWLSQELLTGIVGAWTNRKTYLAPGVPWRTCCYEGMTWISLGVDIVGMRGQGGRSMFGPRRIRAVSGLWLWIAVFHYFNKQHGLFCYLLAEYQPCLEPCIWIARYNETSNLWLKHVNILLLFLTVINQ